MTVLERLKEEMSDALDRCFSEGNCNILETFCEEDKVVTAYLHRTREELLVCVCTAASGHILFEAPIGELVDEDDEEGTAAEFRRLADRLDKQQ